ncbi:hypothetical protein H0H93_010867, partial [Arthromyces matolae]
MAFTSPRKAILLPEQLQYFQTSKTRQEILDFVESLNNAVVGVKLSDECSISPGATAILEILSRVEETAKSIPPVENSASRFGNPAFRTFYDKVIE